MGVIASSSLQFDNVIFDPVPIIVPIMIGCSPFYSYTINQFDIAYIFFIKTFSFNILIGASLAML
jgi:hypothetical protein